MIVFSNERLGPAVELLVSPVVAADMLRETAEAARSSASGWWERELARWLLDRSGRLAQLDHLDIGDIAWSPENFESQRQFLLDAIQRACESSEHVRALGLWARMVEAHPRDSVQVGRRWTWQPTA